MPLISKPNYNQIFASQAPDQDKPAVFNNYPEGWGPESRPNNGKPTIKGFNYLQQTSDLKDLWILQNGACLPYDESIEYAEGAPVLKDGVIQYRTANGFKSRDAVTIPTYNEVAAGVDPVTGVPNGAYYNVRSPDDESYLDEYQNISGVPTPSGKSYPSNMAKWDASSVVDASGKTQQELNTIDSKTEVWVERFAIGENMAVDAVPVFERAIDFAEANGLTNLRFNGKYKFASTTSTWVMPFDDGSLRADIAALDANGILPPEAKNIIPVCIRLPANMTITGTNFETCEIQGNFRVADDVIGITQPILFLQECEEWDGTYSPSPTAKNRYSKRVRGGLDGFTIRNAFHGYVADGVMFRPRWGTMRFAACAIPVCAAGADSFKAERVIFDSRCMSGLVLGGWWQQRSSNSTKDYMPLGSDIDAIGWVDALDIGFLHFGMTPYDRNFIDNRLNALDQYFDTYFWKSANNTTRLSTYKTPTTLTVASDIIEYTGIASRALFAFPRQRRTGQQNKIGMVKIYGSTRPPISTYEHWEIGDSFVEHTGKVNSESGLVGGNIYYTDYTDQYHPTITAPFASLIECAYYSTQDSSVDRHHVVGSPRCPPVGKPQRKVSQKYLSMGQVISFPELSYDDAKAILTAQTIVRPATSTTDTTYQHYNVTPRLQYWSMGKSNVNDTWTKVTNSGEILDKSVCYGYNAINPAHTARVRLGNATATTEINIAFDADLYQRSGNVRANIFFTVSAEMLSKSNAAYFKLPDNLPIYTAQSEFGVRNPNFKLIVLPSATSAIPVRAVITVNSDGQWLSLWKDYAATDILRCNDFAAEGRAAFVLEYTTNEDLKVL